MSDPSPAQQIRNLCDQISDTIESSDPAAPVARYGASEGGGTSSAKSPMTDAMVEARAHLKGVLTSWALLVAEERPDTIDCHDETTAIAAWLYQRADWLAQHPAYPDLIRELEEGIAGIQEQMDRHIDDRRFCGWHNGRPVYARHDQAKVVVDGTVYTPKQGQDRLKSDIAEVDLTAKQCAAVLGQVHGIHVTAKQITRMLKTDERLRQAGRLGEYEGLQAVGTVGDGPKSPLLFRFEEVLTRVQKSTARRSGQCAS